MRIKLPNEVNKIIKIFMLNKYEAYAVGGCIRDSLLNKNPKDWDITTNAKPQEVMELFKNYSVIPTGLMHGTVTLLLNNIPYEITTYRIEGQYSDNRRPDEVIFTNDINMDLSRRDFTINAMAYNTEYGLIDPYNGFGDLLNGVIKCVGDPDKRFNEDALRMLRGIRFSCELEFEINENTKDSIIANSNLLKNISKERINTELSKILLSDMTSMGIKSLVDTNLIEHIIPEINETIGFKHYNPYHDMDVFNHILCVLDRVDKELVLRLSALFHDMAKPKCFELDNKGIGHFYEHDKIGMELARNRLKKLKYSKKIIESVGKLVNEHMCRSNEMTEKGVKRLLKRVGKDDIFKLFNLQIADTLCRKPPNDISNIERIKDITEKILDNKDPITTKDLNINGYDLIELGIPKGKSIGVVLNMLLEMVLEKPKLNNKKSLKEYALSIKNSRKI